MREKDIEVMNNFFPLWKRNINCYIATIALLSSNQHENDMIKGLFPDAKITNLDINSWDLFKPGREEFDLIFACNVFMYSSNPEIWFKHIFEKCRYFWMQDNIRAWRMGNQELGSDGDSMRFIYPPKYLARIDNAYDLRKLDSRIVNFETYEVQTLCGKDALSFILNLKGDIQ